MNFGCFGVIDLMVFDENENLITKLETLKDSEIFYENGSYYIGVIDSVFNFDLQKFLYEEDKLTDFQLATRGFKNTLRIKEPTKKQCKLIGKAFMRKIENESDAPVNFECYDAEIISQFGIRLNNEHASEFDYIFEINQDEFGDYFKINIE